ncbi:hypothetical protein LSAT2_019330 [Lamellibrachia satsuma]|nr:hypothetical protein LSAT2_019330 [Lamellibrachia satsuma]
MPLRNTPHRADSVQVSTTLSMFCPSVNHLVHVLSEDRQVPEPGVGEVLLAVQTVGICRTNVMLWKGRQVGSLQARAPDHVPGHECSASVTKLGPEVTCLRIGERQFFQSCHAAGYNCMCSTFYISNACQGFIDCG